MADKANAAAANARPELIKRINVRPLAKGRVTTDGELKPCGRTRPPHAPIPPIRAVGRNKRAPPGGGFRTATTREEQDRDRNPESQCDEQRSGNYAGPLHPIVQH